MAAPFPWKYPYERDAPRQREVLRPVVPIRLGGPEWSNPVLALVDSGSEHILAAPWVRQDALIEVDQPKYELDLGIAGDVLIVKFADARLRLQHPGGDDDEYIEWDVEVGFPNTWKPTWPIIVGQVGFFSRFTVSLHRDARLTVIEDWDAFDQRFGIDPARPDVPAPKRY